MPKVPVYGQQQVQAQGLPNARITAIPSPDVFGASAGEAIGNSIGKVALIEQQHADEIAAMSLSNESALLSQSLTAKIRSRKGESSFSLPEEIQQDWEKGIGEIRGKARGGHQIQFMDGIANKGWQNLNGEMQVHIDREKTIYEKDQHDAYIENQYTDALNKSTQPKVNGETDEGYAARIAEGVTSNAANSAAAIHMRAARLGSSPEVIEQQSAAVRSRIYAGAVKAQLEAGNGAAAKGLYDTFGDRIIGPQKVDIEKGLEIDGERRDSQGRADQIVAASGNDLSAALAAVKKIEDPKVRAATHDLVRQDFSDRRQAEADASQQRFLDADKRLVESGGNYRAAVPADTEAGMSSEQLISLKERAEHLRNGTEPATDYKVLMKFPVDPAELVKITPEQMMTTYRPYLANADFNRVMNEWRTAKKSEAQEADTGRKSPELSATITFKDRVDNALRSGPNPLIPADRPRSKFTPEQAQVYAQFETDAAQKLEHFEMTQLGGKRKANGEEIQKVVDGLVVDRVFKDNPRSSLRFLGLMGGLPGIYYALKGSTSREEGYASQIPNADNLGYTHYVPIAQIPKEAQEKIRNLGSSYSGGNKPTDDQIQRAYAAAQRGEDDNHIKAILTGR